MDQNFSIRTTRKTKYHFNESGVGKPFQAMTQNPEALEIDSFDYI